MTRFCVTVPGTRVGVSAFVYDPEGKLRFIQRVAEQLHDAYRWEVDDAILFVLTGAIPSRAHGPAGST